MSDEEASGSNRLSLGFSSDWPFEIRRLAELLNEHTDAEITNTDGLGAEGFAFGPSLVGEIAQFVRDLSWEKWPDLQDALPELKQRLEETGRTVGEMVSLSNAKPDWKARRKDLEVQLNGHHRWFREAAKAHALTARIRSVIGDPRFKTDVQTFEDLREKASVIKLELRQFGDELEQAQLAIGEAKDALNETLNGELEEVFGNRASDYERLSEKWLYALAGSVPLAGIIGVVSFAVLRPQGGSGDPHAYAGIGLMVFIIGLLAFAIRICAQNFRVNRHLAAVARSKQASVSTFRLLSSSIDDPRLRSAISGSLAQAIFTVEQTGLTDASGDQVTLLERAASQGLQWKTQ